MNFRWWSVVICSFLMSLLMTGTLRAAEEENVVIRLDLQEYETFNETIRAVYQKGEEKQEFELSDENNYKTELMLPPGEYQFHLSVLKDALHLIKLNPSNFIVTVGEEDSFQECVIEVSDSAGLKTLGDEPEISENNQENSEDVIEPEAEFYSYGSISEEKTGYINIAGFSLSGVRSIRIRFQNKEGKVLSYLLKKENDFKARIQLPYGYYKELQEVEIEPEESIRIPEDIRFYYKRRGHQGGRSFVLSENNREISNIGELQLWAKGKNESKYEVKNMYKFLGDFIMNPYHEESVNFGHEAIPEKILTESTELSSVDEEKNGETELAEIEKKEKVDETIEKKRFSILLLIIAGLIMIAVVGAVFYYRRGEDEK